MVKVHLGIIAGNEEDNIVRFLDSFQPHFDSVSVVRAVGALAPDRTLDMARDRGCLVGEYRNAEAGAAWEHVDNFAAARSQSFDMAPDGTDWIMWADCDDLLAESAQTLLRAIRGGQDAKGDVIYAPYVTDASGSYARRARMVKSSAYRRWVNAVHEDIEHAPDAVLVWSPELQVVHMPANNKRNSPARNRRILEAVPEGDRTGREWWFLFRECEVQADIPNAMTAAVVATGREDLGDEEKFVAYQTIGRYLKATDDAERPLLEAVRLMPHRREGYAELAKLHLARGDGKKALAYAAAMEAQEAPDEPSWTHDASLFGWRAHDLKALALSKAGRPQQAERLRKEWRKRLIPRIAVGHPAGRGQKDIDVRQMWLERAAQPDRVAYYFGICESDAEVVEQLQHYPHGLAQAVPSGHSSAVANYNAAARAATSSGARIFIMAQSDVYPPHGWDEQIMQAMKSHMDKPTVLHVSDGFRGPTDPLMTIMCFNWRWWLGREWLLCPEYDGYWSDTEFSFRAYRDGVVRDGRHIKFYHDHPVFTGATDDETYRRQSNPEANERGKVIFQRRNPDAVEKGW
jgi:tetratricopeptide (TPR) repeat protein